MTLLLKRSQPDGQHKVVPGPEYNELYNRWNHKGKQVDSVPEEVMVVDQDLDELLIKKVAVLALSQSLNEFEAHLVLLEQQGHID